MRFITTIAALMLAATQMSGQAPEKLLSSVESSASVNKTYSADFVEVRKAKNAKDKVCKGSFTYDSKGSIVMTYADPAGEYFKIEDGKLHILRDGKEHDYDAKKTPLAKKMSSSLLSLFAGRVKEAADTQNADYDVQETADSYVVTLTARKKAAKGYGKTSVTYSKKTGRVVSMYLEEFNGNSSTYSL